MVKMVLSASSRQASSATAKCKTTVQAYETVIQSLQSFINEGRLESVAYNNGKQYYSSVLIPYVKANILLAEATVEACQKFVDMYQSEVDSSDLDSDILERQIQLAQTRMNHLDSIRQSITARNVPDDLKDNQLFRNGQAMELIYNSKKLLEDKLDKLLRFEATSPQIFAKLKALAATVNTGKLQTDTAWNGSSFSIPNDLDWTKTIAANWQTRAEAIVAKEKAYHEAKIKELENYNIYAWPYEDPLTKEVSIRWFIDKDGVRIFDEDLQSYVEKYGKKLEGMYEIVGWEKIYELDLAARRKGNGKNYLNDYQLVDWAHGSNQLSANIESAYWYASKTGLLDLAMLAGLSYAASKSQMKATTSTNVANVLDDLDDVAKGKKVSLQKIERGQSDLDDLARDPSHAGKITDNAKLERDIGLALEERGDLGHIVRDKTANRGAEFIDTVTGKKYDVKSFVSYPNGHTSPKKGAFTVENAMMNINKELIQGYNVIINTTNLTSEHRALLIAELKNQGLINRIIFYP